MLTMDNTEGFEQAELDQMNEEVQDLLKEWKPEVERYGIGNMTQYAEKEVLKLHGGA